MGTKILINPIKTELDYEEALERVDDIFDAKINTPEGDELDILVTLIQKYEESNYAILPTDPIEVIRFRKEQMGLTQADLGKVIGSNRISEILNKKRKISLSIMKKLHENLKIPLDVFFVNI